MSHGTEDCNEEGELWRIVTTFHWWRKHGRASALFMQRGGCNFIQFFCTAAFCASWHFFTWGFLDHHCISFSELLEEGKGKERSTSTSVFCSESIGCIPDLSNQGGFKSVCHFEKKSKGYPENSRCTATLISGHLEVSFNLEIAKIIAK